MACKINEMFHFIVEKWGGKSYLFFTFLFSKFLILPLLQGRDWQYVLLFFILIILLIFFFKILNLIISMEIFGFLLFIQYFNLLKFNNFNSYETGIFLL